MPTAATTTEDSRSKFGRKLPTRLHDEAFFITVFATLLGWDAQALAAKVAKAEARANAKLVALAHAIQATVAESRGLPGASARERFKELVLNALAAEKLALKEIAHEPENTSIAEPAAEPAAAPDDADGVLVDSVVVREESKSY